MSMSRCCFQGFRWEGTPAGKDISFPTTSGQAYITGSSKDVAILLIHDIFSWKYPNTRLLADHLAEEAKATVYIPDFFNNEALSWEHLNNEELDKVDVKGWLERNSRAIREPEIFEAAKKLRSEYEKLGAVGYCYGGWGCFRLGARENKLVDCISVGHPSMLTKEDIDNVGVPLQILAPEMDFAYSDELKEYTWKTLPKNGIPFDYQHLPGVGHGCLIRGRPKEEKEREAMARGKNAAVAWFQQWLH